MRRIIGYICVLAGLFLSGALAMWGDMHAQAAADRVYFLPRYAEERPGPDPNLSFTAMAVLPPVFPNALPLPTPEPTPEPTLEPTPEPTLEPTPEPTPAPEPKYIALTFDDGPSPVITPRMLDLLARYDAKCTFFVIGDKARQSPGILARMAAEGHTIGNHTYTHLHSRRATRQKLLDELEATSRAIEEAAGVRPALFRPPYGDFPKDEPTAGGMCVMFWSVDSRDWSLRDAEKILERTLPEVREGSIILMHDIYETTLEAAGVLLEELTAQGYVFVTVETLLAMNG